MNILDIKREEVNRTYRQNLAMLDGETRKKLKKIGINDCNPTLMKAVLSDILQRAIRKHCSGKYIKHSLKGLLYLQVRDACIDQVRKLHPKSLTKHKYDDLEGFENLACPEPSIQEKLEHEETQRTIQQQIDPKLFKMLLLRDNKLTHKQIGEQVGLSEKAVTMRLIRWFNSQQPKP